MPHLHRKTQRALRNEKGLALINAGNASITGFAEISISIGSILGEAIRTYVPARAGMMVHSSLWYL